MFFDLFKVIERVFVVLEYGKGVYVFSFLFD